MEIYALDDDWNPYEGGSYRYQQYGDSVPYTAQNYYQPSHAQRPPTPEHAYELQSAPLSASPPSATTSLAAIMASVPAPAPAPAYQRATSFAFDTDALEPRGSVCYKEAWENAQQQQQEWPLHLRQDVGRQHSEESVLSAGSARSAGSAHQQHYGEGHMEAPRHFQPPLCEATGYDGQGGQQNFETQKQQQQQQQQEWPLHLRQDVGRQHSEESVLSAGSARSAGSAHQQHYGEGHMEAPRHFQPPPYEATSYSGQGGQQNSWPEAHGRPHNGSGNNGARGGFTPQNDAGPSHFLPAPPPATPLLQTQMPLQMQVHHGSGGQLSQLAPPMQGYTANGGAPPMQGHAFGTGHPAATNTVHNAYADNAHGSANTAHSTNGAYMPHIDSGIHPSYSSPVPPPGMYHSGSLSQLNPSYSTPVPPPGMNHSGSLSELIPSYSTPVPPPGVQHSESGNQFNHLAQPGAGQGWFPPPPTSSAQVNTSGAGFGGVDALTNGMAHTTLGVGKGVPQAGVRTSSDAPAAAAEPRVKFAAEVMGPTPGVRTRSPSFKSAMKKQLEVNWKELSKPVHELPKNPYKCKRAPRPARVQHYVFAAGPYQVQPMPNSENMVLVAGTPPLQRNEQYVGRWANHGPEGMGHFSWANSDVYAGEWGGTQRPHQHGVGRYTWADGSTYEGDWVEGTMHGTGTFTCGNAVYTGNWRNGMRSGLGIQRFGERQNDDVYSGMWEDDMPMGTGRYHWHDGSEYNGEMVAGERHGRGTFVNHTGTMFFGEFVAGYKHGRGVCTELDFSFYDGVWIDGVRHGAGVQFPIPTNQVGQVMLQEWGGGKMLREEPAGELFLQSYDLPPMHRQRHAHRLEKKWTLPVPLQVDVDGAKPECNKVGETVYMGTSNYDLMLNLQLGIRVNVMNHLSKKSRELKSSDFEDSSMEEQFFPRLGSPKTPPHPCKDFKFKDYFPHVFHHLRRLCAVSTEEYVRSLCSDASLREMSSPGKSGAAFFISNNDRYLIKTLNKEEMKTLKAILPKYFHHCKTFPDTLLTKFYGLHRIEAISGPAIRIVVMSNLLCSTAPIHRRFDLKGSTQGRFTRKTLQELKPTSVLKDLDLDCTLQLPDKWFQPFQEQLWADTKLLEDLGVIDYSMLMGIHFRDAKQNPELVAALGSGFQEVDLADTFVELEERSKKLATLVNPDHRRMSIVQMEARVADSLNYRPWTKKDRRSNSNSNQPDGNQQSAGPDLTTEALAHIRGSDSHMGICMAATAVPKRLLKWPQEEAGPPRPPLLTRPQSAVIHFGIIDFLQEYNIRKKLEHHGKSLKSGHITDNTISVTNPTAYSQRFYNFLSKVIECQPGTEGGKPARNNSKQGSSAPSVRRQYANSTPSSIENSRQGSKASSRRVSAHTDFNSPGASPQRPPAYGQLDPNIPTYQWSS